MQTTSPVSLGRAGNNQHDTFLPKARRLVWILFILAIANGGSLYLQLKINLRDIRPMIWRRVVVAEDTTLTRLHTVVQTAMGWEGYPCARASQMAVELLRWLWLDVAWSPYAVHVLPAFLEANQEYFAWPTRQFAVVR
jgi:hypothetical protein